MEIFEAKLKVRRASYLFLAEYRGKKEGSDIFGFRVQELSICNKFVSPYTLDGPQRQAYAAPLRRFIVHLRRFKVVRHGGGCLHAGVAKAW